MGLTLRGAAMAPIWTAQLLTGAKSFGDNPILGSRALNARGLHVGRLRLAHGLAWQRRSRLAARLSAEHRAAFDRDGFVEVRDFLAPEHFAALRRQVRDWRGPAREMVQGDTITRRIPLDPVTLAGMPAAETLLGLPAWRDLTRYAGSYDAEPVTYIQTILNKVYPGPPDPQTALHADTFHPSVKAWLFLTDVAPDAGPFVYVPGSHRLTPGRLAWEKRTSMDAATANDRLTRRGSFRVAEAALSGMGLPAARAFPVPANTLVVADTFGFHARGPSLVPSMRVEVWAYGRRNPFLPWTGLDIWSIDALGRRRVPAFWRLSDKLEALKIKGHAWRARENVSAFDGAGQVTAPAENSG